MKLYIAVQPSTCQIHRLLDLDDVGDEGLVLLENKHGVVVEHGATPVVRSAESEFS